MDRDPLNIFDLPYHWIAPSGIHVYSCVPEMESRWWDNPKLHWIWSYASWGTKILEAFGIKWPRKLFYKYWQYEVYSDNYYYGRH